MPLVDASSSGSSIPLDPLAFRRCQALASALDEQLPRYADAVRRLADRIEADRIEADRMERVTGIEPAWPAWKAGDSELCLRWSGPDQADAVPSACLNATPGGARDDGGMSDSAIARRLRCVLLRPCSHRRRRSNGCGC